MKSTNKQLADRGFISETDLTSYKNVSEDELIIWKIIRAFQSFCSKEVEEQLRCIIEKNDNEVLQAEARRSLRQIKKRRLFGLR